MFVLSESTTASSTVSSLGTTPAATDYSQYYDSSAYWQTSTTGYGTTASATWPSYDQTMVAQTDYSAYFQQQAVAHAQSAMAQHQNGVSVPATHHVYNPQNDDLALVGEFYTFGSFSKSDF